MKKKTLKPEAEQFVKNIEDDIKFVEDNLKLMTFEDVKDEADRYFRIIKKKAPNLISENKIEVLKNRLDKFVQDRRDMGKWDEPKEFTKEEEREIDEGTAKFIEKIKSLKPNIRDIEVCQVQIQKAEFIEYIEQSKLELIKLGWTEEQLKQRDERLKSLLDKSENEYFM